MKDYPELFSEIEAALARGNADEISPEALKMLQQRTREEHRCGSVQTANGLPCRRWPTLGTTVCRKHGARAPATMAKAERLLACARLPGIEYLLDTVEQAQSNTCKECGFPNGDVEYRRTVIATAKLVLDRTGLGPKATLQVNASRADDTDTLVEQMTDSERVEALGLLARLDEIKAAVRLRLATEAASPRAGAVSPALALPAASGSVQGPVAEVLDADFRVEPEVG